MASIDTIRNPVMTNQAPLAPTGQHDTHLYRPGSPDDHQLVAVYETLAQANRARDALRATGLADSAVQLVDRTAEQQKTGLWNAFKSFLIPDEDAHGYAESVQRGHAVLVVSPQGTDRVALIRSLEDTGPINFDARLEEWRSAGWSALAAQPAAGVPASQMAATGIDESGAGGTYRGPLGARPRLAGGDFRHVRGYGPAGA